MAIDDGAVALVTGASRAEGLGREVARQLAARGMTVYVTARDAGAAQEVAASIGAGGARVHALGLDVTSDASVTRAAAEVERRSGALDALVNNAGGYYDADRGAGELDPEYLLAALAINTVGALRVARAFLPLLRHAPMPRIVNVGSEGGTFGGVFGLAAWGEKLGAYGVSKAALHALTVKLAAALQRDGVKVNAVCPGFVATRPGLGEVGARPVWEGAAGIVWAATLPESGPTGGFFRDGQRLPW